MLCATVIPKDLPGFRYYLSCLGNSTSGVISPSCANINITSSPFIADLGFDLNSDGWFISENGDVYGGSSGTSVSVGIPSGPDILGGFKDFLVTGIGTVFGASSVSVKNPSSDNKYSEDNNRHVEYLGTDNRWPLNYNFIPPSDANEVDDLDNLDPKKVYKISASKLNDVVDSDSTYDLSEDGVAVVYVTDDEEVKFEGKLTSSSSNKRIVFVSDGSFVIGKDLGVLTPTTATPASVEAALISEDGISFESAGDTDSDGLSDDISVVVEGPLISKSAVGFSRDRGISNGFPAVIVKYNIIYFDSLIKQEIKSSVLNYTGLSVVNVSWERD